MTQIERVKKQIALLNEGMDVLTHIRAGLADKHATGVWEMAALFVLSIKQSVIVHGVQTENLDACIDGLVSFLHAEAGLLAKQKEAIVEEFSRPKETIQ